MSEIREKIMAIEPPDPCRWKNETEWFGNGFRLARNAAADIAEAEVQRLEDENERLRSALADQLVDDTLMKELVIKAGNMHLEMEGGVCKLMAESFAELLVKHNAENYIEASFASKLFLPEEFIVVTVQKTSGKTPHQLRREAELEVQRLEARVRELEDFARFMCATWVEIDSFVRDNCTGDEMMKYPVIQGTSNQLALTRIAKQEYDKANIAKAVELVIGGE